MTASIPNTRTYQASCILATLGISTIPLKPDGTKRPDLVEWNSYRDRIATIEERAEWFAGNDWLGIVCGSISGNLYIIDFDRVGLYDLFLVTAEDHGLGDLVRSLVRVKTPRGAEHLYLRYASGDYHNQVLARGMAEGSKAIIETRGEGGYVGAPPSAGYRLMNGKFQEIPTISADQLDALLAMARLFHELPPEKIYEEDIRREVTPHEGNRPGDDYNARGDILRLLQSHGWKLCYRRGATVSLLRPGKSGDGISATFNHGGHGYLYIFSTNALPFEPERGYRPFSVYALLEHNGNFAAAAAELGRQGYGEPPKVPTVKRTRKTTVPPTEEEVSPGIVDAINEGSAEGEEPPDEIEVSDLGLARAWVAEFRGQYVYVEGDQWWAYDSGKWFYSSHEVVRSEVHHWLARLKESGGAKLRPITAQFTSNIKNMVGPELRPITLNRFNPRKDWIPLRNGVYDLTSGELLPHSPINMLTRQSSFEFDVNATCPTWLRCLSEWLIQRDGKPCVEWMELLQEWFGYCLIPDNRQQLSMFWVGEGANGKGTATRVLSHLVSEECSTPIMIDQLHNEYYRANLYGKLVGLVNEPSRQAMQKNGGTFKALTGGEDPIDARRPTEKPFQFIPFCRIIVTCNALPATNDPSNAYFRRICPIEWRYDIPEDSRDSTLDDKLHLEISGIFNWALVGLRRLQQRQRFLIPSESRKMLERYRQSEDHIGRYLAEECIFDAEEMESAADLYRGYKTWCEQNGFRIESATALGLRLNKRHCEQDRKRKGGVLMRVWTGVRLRSEKDDDKEFPG